ncbi:phenylacetate--CoA ligase family protein [Syntrophobacter fumaroxidans]|uniref:Coenzyme F390 synthetase-like n=1 Tax=Syntrophobacter fumaroxidans (strain DSM 10017 / MPOB) TaxID=335543 RepID=A0LNK3_SYNFM|nr:phenylacetate--CoA ligase family protein [Syntrophobacter fumaroxidans]ABK19005.1 Coenzyme F390 synthetase-like [Syntrophobacter fumaroxidans MPOB]
MRAYQEEALEKILSFACDQIPAYRHLRSVVARFRPFDALQEFPLLDKETLQSDMSGYLPRDFDRIPHHECSTGGTSGNQLRFFLDDQSQSIEMAFMHLQWARVGYTPGCRKATFRGVEFRSVSDRIYWQPNPVYNELQFSPFHMNEATLDRYLHKLGQYRPRFIHGYPSAISLLADFITRNRLKTGIRLQLDAVLLASEGILPGQRELIEEAFSTRVYSWYGHSERVVLAGECEKSPAYHHFPDYGILEIIDDNGNVLQKEGEPGEIVGTGLINRSLPLIRYRTGDKARMLGHECACGRSFDRFDQVEGRWRQEFVIGKTGSRISLAALNMHGPLFDHIVRYQYYQKRAGELQLRVMVSSGFTALEKKALQEAYARKTGSELSVEVKTVEDIPLTSRGKLRRLVQNLQTGPSFSEI